MAKNKPEKEQIRFGNISEIAIVYENVAQKFPPHWHNALEFTLALKDDCSYRVNDKLYKLAKGDVLLVWPQQIHEIVSAPYDAMIFTQFSASILEHHLDLLAISSFLYDCHHIEAKKTPELAKLICDRLFEIKKIHTSPDPLAETRCKLCIYDILLHIGTYVLEEHKDDLHADKTSEPGYHYVHAACSFINDNAADNISQVDAANYVGLSSFYFSKLFKQYMNMSFPAYLSGIRVKNAVTLLLDEDLSITDCAFRSGFQSTTAFNKAFHETTGYSPREFRKMYRK
ncbi:MAG: AraC family transcriptional regulator [Lachnospiraceae bacterium]|nr:AraC family transcriptional regulator [Lachnospiraceae bacterium]